MNQMHPVPGWKVTTPYRRTGPWWKACGFHTGVDIAAPKGTPIVAARSGVVRWTRHGTAFGPNQFSIECADGTADFYAHTLDRPANGKRVTAGDRVARVGALGNAPGPHLHFERHNRHGPWTCANIRDPQPSIDHEEGPRMAEYWYSGKPPGELVVSTRYVTLDRSKWDPKHKGLQHSLVYLNVAKVEGSGLLRIRMMRADNDNASAYHDYPINGPALITHTYFELGNGQPIRWQLKCMKGLKQVTITTRYTKGSVVA